MAPSLVKGRYPMPVALIAKQSFPYAGKSIAAGDLFEASERDAHVLKTIGRAEDAPRLRKSPYARKDVTADAPEPAIDTPKRQYRRRDLVPEP